MHSVHYTTNGDIILETQSEVRANIETIGNVQWNIITPKVVASKKALRTNTIGRVAKKIALFPANEIAAAYGDIHTALRSGLQSTKAVKDSVLKRIYTRLSQPIFIVKKRKKLVKTNRLLLFVSDVVRFGTTFAVIFALLFVSLNYESFWAIASDQINPVASMQKKQQLSAQINKVLANHTQEYSYESGTVPLLSKLPMVGPKENILIIPKLGLSAPIQTPEYEALLREDWDKLEKDIQRSLEGGVVHYPGTAVAGQPGNFFVTGHSSYNAWSPGAYKSIFAKLHLLNVGDEYYVYYNGDKHKYIIQSKEEVQPNNVHVLDQPLDKRISTLMTCTPVGTTLRRLIVRAQEVDPLTNIAINVTDVATNEVKMSKPAVLPI